MAFASSKSGTERAIPNCIMKTTSVFFSVTLVAVFSSSSSVVAFPARSEFAAPGEPAAQPAIATGQDLARARVYKVDTSRPETSTNPHPDLPINVTINGATMTGGPSDGSNPIDNFDVIAVVNKASRSEGGQTLTIYRFKTIDGVRVPDGEPETYVTSTGQEDWNCEFNRDTGRYEWRWLGTPTQYGVVHSLSPDHSSSRYPDERNYAPNMRFASRFGGMGLAIHVGNTKSEFASHGCVRSDGAKAMFAYTLRTGPQPNPESPEWNAKCPHSHLVGAYQTECLARAAARRPLIRNLIDRAIKDQDQVGGFYSLAAQVPALNRDGTVKRDPVTQQGMISDTRYRTLVIIQCVYKDGRTCATTQARLDGLLREAKDRDARSASPVCTQPQSYQQQGSGFSNPFQFLVNPFFPQSRYRR